MTKRINLLDSLLLIIPIINTSLLIAAFYSVAMAALNEDNSLRYILEGLIVTVPVVLSYISAKKLKYIWQYLIVALACSAVFIPLSYLLAIISLVLFFIRFVGRMGESKGTVLDSTHYAICLFFIVPFMGAGIYKLGKIQFIAVLFAFIYFVFTLIFRLLKKLDSYIEINKNMANFPLTRVRNVLTRTFLIVSAVVMFIGLFAILFGFHFVDIEVKEIENVQMPKTVNAGAYEEGMDEETFDLSQLETGKGLNINWNIVGGVILVICSALIIPFIISLLVNMSRIFRRLPVSEKSDYVESISDESESTENDDSTIKRLDFSDTAKVRRRYIKAVKSKKYKPESWQTPAEIELGAKIKDSSLHEEYEKVRYGK